MSKFRARCHIGQRTPAGVVECHLDTDDTDAFLFHMKTAHNAKPLRQPWRWRPWKRPSDRPFEPEPFGLGSTVSWVDPKTETTLTGQVWALHSKDARWIADGEHYHLVREYQLVSRTWRAA
jgi:hypothetical protein